MNIASEALRKIQREAVMYRQRLIRGEIRLVPETASSPAKQSDEAQRRHLTSVEREFEEQKAAFLRIPREELARYSGQYVAVRNGTVMDHDPEEDVLVRRFFDRLGDVPVYITKIGDEPDVVIVTPFLG